MFLYLMPKSQTNSINLPSGKEINQRNQSHHFHTDQYNHVIIHTDNLRRHVVCYQAKGFYQQTKDNDIGITEIQFLKYNLCSV